MNINHTIISGHLTRDAEVRTTASGAYVIALGLAVNDRVRNKQTGAWEDRPNFIDITYFVKDPSNLAPILTKGTYVTVDGKLHWNQWERDGQKRSKVEVLARFIEIPPRQKVTVEGAPEPAPVPAEFLDCAADDGLYSEDIPF